MIKIKIKKERSRLKDAKFYSISVIQTAQVKYELQPKKG